MTKGIELIKWCCFGGMLVFLFVSFVSGAPSRTPFAEMQSTVASAADMTNLTEGDHQMIRRLYGLDPEDYRGIALYYPASNMAAEELLLVQLNDRAQEEKVLDAVRERQDNQADSFEGYGVEQTEMLAHGVIESKGNYVLYVVAEDPAPVKAAFLSRV